MQARCVRGDTEQALTTNRGFKHSLEAAAVYKLFVKT